MDQEQRMREVVHYFDAEEPDNAPRVFAVIFLAIMLAAPWVL